MKISITRALSEIKLLEKKINKKISEFTPTAVVIGKKSPLGFESIDKFTNRTWCFYCFRL